MRTIISAKLKKDFAKSGLNGLADYAANVFTPGERDWDRNVSWNSKVRDRGPDLNPHLWIP